MTLNTKTGFAQEAFKEDELNPEFYDSPEKKMTFLKQILKIVYERSSKESPLQPKSIIKGTECDKTNEFLQDMYHFAVSFEEKRKTKPEKATKSPIDNVKKAAPQNTRPVEPVKLAAEKPVEKKKAEEPAREISQAVNKGKENLVEKRNIDTKSKITQQVNEQNAKEDKITAKPRINSGTSNSNGIKMGKLAPVSASAANPMEGTTEMEGKEVNYSEIKSTLQKLTQNTNPLGKLVEFVDDDLDAMNKECKRWVQIFMQTQEKMEKIEEEQNDELQNYHFTLNEINEQIFDYQNKILSIKSRIQKNNSRIDSMLAKVIGLK